MVELLFILFGVLTLGAALGVVVSKNPIYSAVSLILTFLFLAILYLLWGAPFIAVLQVLIYTGAIVVLFIFVLMMLPTGKKVPTHSSGWVALAAAGITVWFFSLILLRVLNKASYFRATADLTSNSIRAISRLLFNEYLWPFEVLSLFLLGLIVAVFILTVRHGKEQS